jgi:hypothetical protein
MHTVEPLVFELRSFEAGITTEKFKTYKLSSADQILAEMSYFEGKTFCSKIHKLIHSA